MTKDRLDELAARERNEYYRRWREKNRDKVKQYNQNYWRKRVEQRLLKKEEQNAR